MATQLELEKPLYRNLDLADYLLLPRIYGRYDIIDGDLFMSPAPTSSHQWYLLRFVKPVQSYVESNRLGVILIAPVDVLIQRDPKLRMRQPDLLFLSSERTGVQGIDELEEKPFIDVTPDLVVEILSSDEFRRLPNKLSDYASIGVLEVWLASRDGASIEVLRLEGSEYMRAGVYGLGDVLESSVLPAFKLPVERVFGKP